MPKSGTTFHTSKHSDAVVYNKIKKAAKKIGKSAATKKVISSRMRARSNTSSVSRELQRRMNKKLPFTK